MMLMMMMGSLQNRSPVKQHTSPNEKKQIGQGSVRYCSPRPRELLCCSAGLQHHDGVRADSGVDRLPNLGILHKNTLLVNVSAARVQVLNSIKTKNVQSITGTKPCETLT